MKKSAFYSLALAAAALPTLWAADADAQTQLIVNGTFTTTPVITNNLSQDVGRVGTGAANILDGATGTAGWITNGTSPGGTAGRFEVWAPGYLGSPTGVGNSLELANNGGGSTTYQDVATGLSTAALSTFSFGYATRDSGTDRFTVTITDQSANGTPTLFTQTFNPTGSFATNQLFSTNLTVTPGDTYRVSFLDQNTTPSNGILGLGGYPANSLSAHIDQVSFVQGVPEPTPFVGVLAGLAGLGLVQRFRRQRDGLRQS